MIRLWAGVKSLSGYAPHLCQSGKVHQRQVEDMGRVDLEVDGLSVNTLVGSGNSGGLVLNLALDVGEVVEASVGNVVELSPLGASRRVGGAEAILYGLWCVLILGNIDELQNEGASGANTAASRQKISADNVFENGRLAGRLGADNNLWWDSISGCRIC